MDGLNVLEWCLAQAIPIHQVKVISITNSSPVNVFVEGPILDKSVVLNLGVADIVSSIEKN